MANANNTRLYEQSKHKEEITIMPAKFGIDGYVRLAVVSCCCAVDFSINAYRVDSLALDGLLRFAFYTMSAILAVSPSLLTLFGDEKSEKMGWIACAGTLVFSCWSIFGFTNAKADVPRVSAVKLQSIEQQAIDLDTWYDNQVKICAKRSIDQCDSALLHDTYLVKKSELRAAALEVKTLPKAPSGQQNTVDMALLVGLSFLLQLVSREFSRHLSGAWRSCREGKEQREHDLKVAHEKRKRELVALECEVLEFEATKKSLPRAV